MKRERVLVGLSGGVDSAVSALLLMRAGYDVVGGFIRTWHPDFVQCDEERDRLDAMRVAAHLGIALITIDARQEYKKDVADVMISEYAHGRTPNPDMLCNRHVKFSVLDRARESIGARYIATGHYARIVHETTGSTLYRGSDPTKDQSYFLARVDREVLTRSLFPLGEMQKSDVRDIARGAHLPNATRKDSQGICFLGKIDMQTFLSHYIPLERGVVLDVYGSPIGEHDGTALYTIGERHGFRVSHAHLKTVPLYVVGKNVTANTITVDATPPQHAPNDTLVLNSTYALVNSVANGEYDAVLRYHGTPTTCTLTSTPTAHSIVLHDSVDRPSPGQTCVLYRDNRVIMSGIIESV